MCVCICWAYDKHCLYTSTSLNIYHLFGWSKISLYSVGIAWNLESQSESKAIQYFKWDRMLSERWTQFNVISVSDDLNSLVSFVASAYARWHYSPTELFRSMKELIGATNRIPIGKKWFLKRSMNLECAFVLLIRLKTVRLSLSRHFFVRNSISHDSAYIAC